MFSDRRTAPDPGAREVITGGRVGTRPPHHEARASIRARSRCSSIAGGPTPARAFLPVARPIGAIRHAVYCEELGYEPVRDDCLESDVFDQRSVHCLLQSVTSGEYVGCVRIVLADPSHPLQALPFEGLCGDSIDRAIVDPEKLDRTKIAEVSRLAVIARYRRRRGEQKLPLGLDDSDFGTPDRPRFPYIAVGLYLGMLAQARRLGIGTLFMLTDRRLAKQLARLGVGLRTIGQHRGTRYPSMMSVQEVIDGFSFFVRPLFAVIAGEINEAYHRRNDVSAPVTPASSGNPS
jgi:N-acyl amino acid synthase of PEP-CTERM/exosortase system